MRRLFVTIIPLVLAVMPAAARAQSARTGPRVAPIELPTIDSVWSRIPNKTATDTFVTPGRRVHIDGSHFGNANGRVTLLGQLPRTNGEVQLPIVSWTDTGIEVDVPKIEGALEQPRSGVPAARIRVERNDQLVGEKEVTFQPTYVEMTFDASPTDGLTEIVACSPNTNDDVCKLRGEIYVRHRSITHLTPSGQDVFKLKLKNGWRIARLVQWKDHTSSVTMYYPIESSGGPESKIKVYWNMPTVSRLEYSFTVVLIGPAGTTYR